MRTNATPYELRGVDGQPVAAEAARRLIAERYTVPEEVRRQTSQRRRREQCERRAEKKQKREGRRH